MSKQPENKTGTTGRRRILYGLGVLSLLSFFKAGFLLNRKRNVIGCAPPEEKRMEKLLTEDGQLVEVDLSKIISTGRKVSDKELIDWIKK